MRVFPSFFAAGHFVSADAELFLPQKKSTFSYKLSFVGLDEDDVPKPHFFYTQNVMRNQTADVYLNVDRLGDRTKTKNFSC